MLKLENKVIGSIQLMSSNSDVAYKNRLESLYSGIDFGNNPYEIGYLLSPKYWNKGIMTEVCVLAVDFCFEKLGATAIAIGAYKENVQSGKVQDKVGFEIVDEIEGEKIRFNGISKTSVRRIMTKEHWQKIRSEKIKKYVSR